jgi:hypothetical protein
MSKEPRVVLFDPPGVLRTDRLPDGRRQLVRDLVVSIDGRKLKVPKGFKTDLSSWFWIAPPYFKIDLAGVVHDYLARHKAWGKDGEPMSLIETNRIWYIIAREGEGVTQAGPVTAWIGRIGLFGWAVWKEGVDRLRSLFG